MARWKLVVLMTMTLILNLWGLNEAGSGQPSLAWNVTASSKVKDILHHVVGAVDEGTLHAIIGPSGSGKSTLISMLSNTVKKGSLKLTGKIAASEDKKIVYVQQEDLLFAQLTSEETLVTSSRLKSQNKKAEVHSLLNRLGLKKVSTTKVGNEKTRGISGGEKKRLSIGNELIGGSGGTSQIIYADEPTSGLDSFAATNVVTMMRQLADEGNTVIAAIHQPSTKIFDHFDTVTLLTEGSVVYSGERKEMLSYFKAIGYPCPAFTNPCEYYIDLVSIDYTTPEKQSESQQRVASLKEIFAVSAKAAKYKQLLSELPSRSSGSSGDSKSKILPRKSLGPIGSIRASVRKTATLFVRAWRNVVRDKSLNIARFMSSLFSALLFGAIYYKLSDKASTVPDRLGLLQVAAVNTAMTSLIKATTSFVQEKFIVNRERRGESYTVVPYFLSKLTAEAPLAAFFPCMAGTIMYLLCGLNKAPGKLITFLGILMVESFASSSLGMLVGSYAGSVDSAIAIAPAVMVIFIVFGGLYVVNTPKWLSLVPRASLIRWAYQALVINEFDGLELTPEARFGPKSVKSGAEVLENMDLSGFTVKDAILANGCIMGFNYLATMLSLMLQRPSFEPVLPYPAQVEEVLLTIQAVVADTESARSQEEASVNEEGKINKRRPSTSKHNRTPLAATAPPRAPGVSFQ